MTDPDILKPIKITTSVCAKDHLNETLLRLRLNIPDQAYPYFAGQRLKLYNATGIGRDYCLSSVPGLDNFLELHISLTPNGALMPWIFEELEVGAQVQIGPASSDFHCTASHQKPILLIGTGIALAPLYGILREALIKNQHKADIRLFHETHNKDEYYIIQDLILLQTEYSNFSYKHFVSGSQPNSVDTNLIHTSEMAFGDLTDLRDWEIFLCGDQNMIERVKHDALELNANANFILEEPFKMPNW
ncbi:MAG: FAD-binding oxidoreductase [Methylococcaceae bacterium]|jgi:ferredoxin-NADP reductase